MIEVNEDDYLFCPISFRLNCANYEIKCATCAASSNSTDLDFYYSPVLKEVELIKKKHPYLVNLKKSKAVEKRREKVNKRATSTSKLVKKALRSERSSIKSIGAKSTIASGRFTGQGDGFISINGVDYYIEVKTRYSDKGSQFPTSIEWKKAVEQNCKIFIVETTKGAIVSMSKETFKELFSYE